ncbi:hypothetical protein C8R45DRAFT_1080749 [Mycena sanguinolenta]|nr:hypothetical protein C8R45DRAFT_1080749 [Mycena sanguinolenta]
MLPFGLLVEILIPPSLFLVPPPSCSPRRAGHLPWTIYAPAPPCLSSPHAPSTPKASCSERNTWGIYIDEIIIPRLPNKLPILHVQLRRHVLRDSTTPPHPDGRPPTQRGLKESGEKGSVQKGSRGPRRQLLLVLVEAIDDAVSLRSFALTCKLACVLTEPVLYRTVLVTTGSQAWCLAKARQQQQPSTRAELMQALDLRLAYSRDADVEVLTSLLGTMTQLHALSMESPFAIWRSGLSRSRWEALTQGFRALFLDAQCGVGLQKLESCVDRAEVTIHWSGDSSRFWLLKEFKPILTLRSCRVSASRAPSWTTASSTAWLPLPKALTGVLALPRALRSCHLGFMRHYSSDSNNYQSASPEQFLEALHQQRHSLQQLTWFDKDFAYDTDVFRVSTVPGSGLYNFTELHTLTLDGASVLLLSTLLSERAPPHLDRLRIIRHDTCTILDHPTDSVASTRIPGIPSPLALHQHLPTLHHLDIVFLTPVYDTEPLWTKPDRRDRVKRLGEDYHARGIWLAIFAANRGGVMLPYLFGEEPPREKLAYRAENAWFSPEMT